MIKSHFILILTMAISSVTLAGVYSDGNGSPENPYQIATEGDMNEIGSNPQDWGSNFLMTADINLADYTGTEFNLIGYYEAYQSPNNIPFTGVFDGNSHTISNFTYTTTDTDYIGLFGYINDPNAEIKDLTLINPDVNAIGNSSCISCLVCYLGNGTISGCGVEGGSVSGYFCVGGLVGYNKGSISNCFSTSNVSGGEETTGGLVAHNQDGTISNCYATGNVLGEWGNSGGLVGYNQDGAISNCYATGDVSGYDQIGGLVGRNSWRGTILNCHATGNVSGYSHIGGLAGDNNSEISNCYATGSVSRGLYPSCGMAGGLCGVNTYSGTISNCYATGPVDVYQICGGLVGINDGTIRTCYAAGEVTGCDKGSLIGRDNSGNYTKSFWDTDVNPDVNGIGNADDPNVIGKTTAEMQTESTFANADWDFIEIWNIGENQTYPFLRKHLAGNINHDDIVDFYDFAILSNQWLKN